MPFAWSGLRAKWKASWFTRLPASESADALLQERYRTTLKTVLDGWESNDFAEIVTKDGKAVSASLKDGTVTAVLLVAKLQSLDNKNLIHRGLEEYGRLLKTIDILTFLSNKPYRRRIGRMLNKGEAVHSLARLMAMRARC